MDKRAAFRTFVLAAFAKAGLLRTGSGSVTPLDLDGLRRIKDGSAAP